MKPTYRSLLDATARLHIPDGVDLYPRIAARLAAQRGGYRALMLRPAVMAAVIVLSLGLLSGIVYAVGRSLGYIPGVGIVSQDAALRVLEEPVVVEREGITLTVTQAVASSDTTIISYEVEDIPETALSPDFREGQTPPPTCSPWETLRLPDGTVLTPSGGEASGWGLGFRARVTFDPLPPEINEVILQVSCLLGTSPGMAPENWQVSLNFIPAPPDLTLVPVMEITPSAASTEPAGTDTTTAPSPISIERTIELDDSYILIGSFHAITTAGGLVTSPYVWSVRMIGADGNAVPFDYAGDIDFPPGTESTAPWAYRILGKAQPWPITITIDTLEAALPAPNASFEFDTGPAPLAGQVWTLNQELQIGDYRARILDVSRTQDGYAFRFQADPEVIGIAVEIRSDEGTVPPAGGGGGAGDGMLDASVAYVGPIPQGELTVVLSQVTVSVPGPWSIEWQPEDAAQAEATPSPGQVACVTDTTWNEALASRPAQLPSGLPGRFFIFGPSSEGTRFGISVLDLADGSRRFLAEGSWPVVSPDGSQVIYTGSAGLEIYDLDSGETRLLPGTDPGDYRMAWSPAGDRIAFVRSSTNQIMTINADGSNQQVVRDNAAIYHGLVGWSASDQLLITSPGPQGVVVQTLDLASGVTEDLFVMSSNKADTVISPDGAWIAYTNSRGGMLGNGLYIARLDGSQTRLLAALDGRALYFPIWSPDGNWLILSLSDSSDPVDQMAQALVSLDACVMTALPDLGGEVYSWGK